MKTRIFFFGLLVACLAPVSAMAANDGLSVNSGSAKAGGTNPSQASGDVATLLQEAQLLATNKESQKLLALAELIIKKNPNNSEGYRYRALAHRLLKDVNGAKEDYDKALVIDPNNFHAWTGRSQFKREQNDLQGALADANHALEINPGYPNALITRAQIYYDLKDYQKCIADSSKAIELAPGDTHPLERRGMALERTNDFNGALKDFEAVLSKSPNNGFALVNRGWLLSRLGRNDEAIQEYTKALKNDPSSPSSGDNFIRRGKLYQAKGMKTEAAEDFAQALQKNPENREAAQLLAQLRSVAGASGVARTEVSSQKDNKGGAITAAASPTLQPNPPRAENMGAPETPVALADAIDADVLAGGRPGGEVLATKGLMRVLGGPLSAAQEKELNARYAKAYSRPTAATAARHHNINKGLIGAIVQREIMLRSIREHDAAMKEAAIAEQLGNQEGRNEALEMAGIQQAMLQKAAANLAKIAETAAADENKANSDAEKPDNAKDEYREALALLNSLKTQPEEKPSQRVYLGRWVLEKVIRASLKGDHSFSNCTTLDSSENGLIIERKYSKDKLSAGWDKPPEDIPVAQYSEGQAPDPREFFKMKVWIKGSTEATAHFFWLRNGLYTEATLWGGGEPSLGNYSGKTNNSNRLLNEANFLISTMLKPPVLGNSDTLKMALLLGVDCGNNEWLGSGFVYKWIPDTGGTPQTADMDILKEFVIGDSLDAQKQTAIKEHLTNIEFAQKNIEFNRRALANTKDPATADRIRFNILHSEQDIHDSKDEIESVKSGQSVHTRGPWEQHAEAVAIRQSQEIAERAERAHQMQASALRMASVLGKYSPEDAKKAHELILGRISTGLFNKDGMANAEAAFDQIHALTKQAMLKDQGERESDQEKTRATADRTARAAEYVEAIKRNADRAVFIGTMFTPMGPGAAISIAYEGMTASIEKGPVEAIKRVAKTGAALVVMAGAVKGGQAILGKFINPKVAASTDEVFSAAKFNEELKFNQLLVDDVKKTQAALNKARTAGESASKVAGLEAAASDAVSVANSSTLAKRIMKNELFLAEEAVKVAKQQVKMTAKNPEALKAALRTEAEATQRLLDVEATHVGFQGSLNGTYNKIDDALIRDLQSQGYNVERNWFMEFRNATSKGVNADRDFGLKGHVEAFLKQNGNPCSVEVFMENAQKSYNKSYRFFNGGRSAKLADQSITTSAFNEAFPLEFLDSTKVGTASADSFKRAGKAIFNKVENALAGSDPEFVKLQKAYASLSKDLKTKVLPSLDKLASTRNNPQAIKYWEDVTHVMDDFAKGRIGPITATQQMRQLTGGKTMKQVAGDVVSMMRKRS